MEVAFLVLAAYLFGSVPTAVWLGRALRGMDVRDHGSGNAGATNTIRILGSGLGFTVLLIDMLKGYLAVFILSSFTYVPGGLNTDWLKVMLAFAAVLGHIFPIFAGFRGGKGVATFMGTALAIFPLTFVCSIGIFLLAFLSSRYVSLGSILSALLMPVFAGLVFAEPAASVFFALVVALVIPLTHRRNLSRLLKGEEHRLSFSRKGK